MSGISKIPPKWTDTEANAVVDALDALIAAPPEHGNAAHDPDFLSEESDPSVDATLKGVSLTTVQDHTPKAHTLASHSTKAHSELTDVGTSDHHTKYTDAEAVAAVAAANKEGTTTISAGNTEITVTHNKGVLNYPVISSCDELEGRDCWTEYVDVNSFKIHISMADLENDHIFNYHV